MITIARIDPMDPTALRLIEGSEVEQAALYPPEVRFAFSPEQLVADEVRFYVGHLGGQAHACGGYGCYDGYAELKRIFVEKPQRGKGLADALVLQMEQDARAEGIGLMRLESGEASPAALKLYMRLGYHRISPFGSYSENGSSVFMEKSL